MSQPLKESPQSNFAQSQPTTPSKLYTILKEENGTPPNDTENSQPAINHHRNRPRQLAPRVPHEWQCWQCQRVYGSEQNLATHIMSCKLKGSSDSTLEGCPFCPRDAHYTSIQPFTIHGFNSHVEYCHPDIAQLACAYCLEFMSSPRLEELSRHVLREHHIPWRPSPASLAYLRSDQLPHRVVTCMGCGWCTFVLHANNAVQPPVSLASHMERCAFSGGRVYLTPLTPEMYATAAARKRTLAEAEKASREFCQSFPLVRGHATPPKLSSPPQSRPRKDSATPAPKKRKIEPTSAIAALAAALPSSKKPAKPRVAPKPKSKPKPPAPKPTPVDTEKSVKFDVPLSLPPAPRTDNNDSQKKAPPARLYVCPLCGDNALASLRERDEHLQASHNGELVFPCQICGLAYPLYIALRRHAALKHDSDFDTVRYGRPELVESDSLECPLCKLVAFTDRSVLKLHVAEVHQEDPEQVKLPSKPGARGGSKKGSRRRSKYGDQNDGAAYAITNNPQPVKLSRLEKLLAGVEGDPAPISCRICRTQMDNAKEFLLHLELDHVETEEECEQLGCQACGRIFFGPGGRIDLIGHLRVIHQDNDQPDALSCLQAEKILEEGSDGDADKKKSNPTTPDRLCDATFSSPRLRQLHCTTSGEKHPGFACPLTIELVEDQDLISLTDQIRAAIMETEVAADREGLMILAYCCPNCSRLFAGHQAPSRFAIHRRLCMLDQIQTTNVAVPANTLQPVTRIEIQPAAAVAAVPVAATVTTTTPAKLTATALIKDAVPVAAVNANLPNSTDRIIAISAL